MFEFFKKIIFPGKATSAEAEKGIQDKNFTDPSGLAKPLFGKAEMLDYEFDKELSRQEKTFQEIAIFQKVNQIILSNLDSREISRIIVDEIRKKLGYMFGVLFVVDKEHGTVWPYVTSTEVTSRLEFFYGKKTEKHVGYFKDQNNLVFKSIFTGNIYIGNDLRDFVSPVLSYRKAYTIQKVMGMKTFILIPLKIKDKVVGVLLVVSRREGVDSKEKILLKMLADQVGIALYNANLFKQTQSQIIHLQEKTHDMESLLSLSRNSSSAVGIEKNIQNILDIIPIKLEHLNIVGAILVRYSRSSQKAYLYSTTESPLSQKARKLLTKKSLSDYYLVVNKKNRASHNLTIQGLLNSEIMKSDDLLDFISPPVEKPVARLIQKVVGAKAVVGVPVNMRGNKLGVLIFLFTKPLSQVGERDMNILNAFTQHVGVVMENLHFYHHLNRNIEELTRAKDKLKEMLAMKNDFLHIVSHQLRTPLTAMRGFISMWSEGDFDALPKDKMLEIKNRIVNNSERLNNIVNDMVLAMESEGELKVEFKPMDIGQVLQGNIEMLKPNFEKKNLYLRYKEVTKDIPKIEADEKLLLNVFMNLIDNAEKYTDEGGLTIAVGQEGDNVKVEFIDTGIGLSKEDKKILFKKFSRGAKSNYINPNGSGLGLFIIKQIITKHYGKIKAASKGEGKGSTFTIILPIKRGG